MTGQENIMQCLSSTTFDQPSSLMPGGLSLFPLLDEAVG